MEMTCWRWACGACLTWLYLASVACSDDPAPTSAVVTAVLEGRVRNGLTQTPLPEVTIRIVDAHGADRDLEVTTDNEGRFRAAFSGAGRFTYELQREGFARVQSSVTFDISDVIGGGTHDRSSTYNVTQRVVQDLFPLTGTLRARVVGSGSQDVIADAPITFRFFANIDDVALPTAATTDDRGTIEVSNLPAGTSFDVTVRATDRDGDGVIDTSGHTTSVTLEADAITDLIIGPLHAIHGPGVLSTNIDDRRLWPGDATFSFAFRTPMDTDPSATIVHLRDAASGTTIATTTAWNTDASRLTISPVHELGAGRQYLVSFTAWSRLAEPFVSDSYRVHIEGTVVAAATITGLQWLDDPAEQELFDTAFRIAIDSAPDVDRVAVYGRRSESRNARTTDWVHIQDLLPTDGFPKMHYTINIVGDAATRLSSFAGSATTFFGRGETLEIAASAVLNDLEGPLSAPIALFDGKCLDVALTTGTNNTPNAYFDNTGASTGKPILFQIATHDDYFSEDSQAVITIESGPFTTNGFVLSEGTLVHTRVDRSTFQLTGEIPAGRDAQLDLVSVDLATLRDPSGNPACQSVLQTYTPGVRGNDDHSAFVWNFQNGNQDWTATGGFTRGTGPNHSGTSMIWSTGLTGPRADNTASTLRSPRVLLPNAYTLSWIDRRDLDASDTLSFRQLTDDGARTFVATQSLYLGNDCHQVTATNVLPGVWSHLEIRYAAGTPSGGLGTATATGYSIDDVSLSGTWDRNLFYDGTN